MKHVVFCTHTHIMLTIYAKNLAGDILHLSFPSSLCPLRDEEVCQAISPDDPSSVRLVSRRHPVEQEQEQGQEGQEGQEEKMGMDDDALQDMMEELHAMASEEEEGEEEEEEEGKEDEESEEAWFWENGDTVEYLMEEQELTVHLTPPMGGPYYAVSDPEDRWPLYPFTVWVEREEETGLGKEKRVIHSWSFLFSLRNGLYRGPSDYAMEVEGGGGDVYLALRTDGTWHTSVFNAIRADEGVPTRYKERMLRAVYRKWVRILRQMARRTPEERDVHAMYPTEWVQGEKTLFQTHYHVLRKQRRDMRYDS